MDFDESLDVFLKEVIAVLTQDAKSKGYHGNELDGRVLFDEVHTLDYGHPMGEIKYKLRRFRSKHEPLDIVKVAAWAFLIWDKNRRELDELSNINDSR